ncbi:hypothetical protein D3C87_1978950 [compost metagenome]
MGSLAFEPRIKVIFVTVAALPTNPCGWQIEYVTAIKRVIYGVMLKTADQHLARDVLPLGFFS